MSASSFKHTHTHMHTNTNTHAHTRMHTHMHTTHAHHTCTHASLHRNLFRRLPRKPLCKLIRCRRNQKKPHHLKTVHRQQPPSGESVHVSIAKPRIQYTHVDGGREKEEEIDQVTFSNKNMKNEYKIITCCFHVLFLLQSSKRSPHRFYSIH